VGLDAGADWEWLLYWTARDRPVPYSRVPVLAGWADLDQREADAGITGNHPILIDPQCRIDPVLARFLAASRFTWLAEGTRQAYAKDYRLFFSFLWQRGKYRHEADQDDLLDSEAWRRRSQPGLRISGSKWQRELAALRLLYEWVEKKGHIARSPVLVHAVRLRDGSMVMAADQAPRDVCCSDVKWVTPRTYRLWLQVGLLGYDTSGQPDRSWRGRNDGGTRRSRACCSAAGCGCGRAAACSPWRSPTQSPGSAITRAVSRARWPSGASACSTPRPPRCAALPPTWPPPGRTRSAAPGGTAATSGFRES
jgi:Phage integrase, N-terminal SAM-like domain